MTTMELIKSKRGDILRIASKHGARDIRIFGSVINNEDSPQSDIDFLVEAGQNTSPFFPGGLVADLEDLLGKKVDVVTPKALHRLIRDRVLKEAAPL